MSDNTDKTVLGNLPEDISEHFFIEAAISSYRADILKLTSDFAAFLDERLNDHDYIDEIDDIVNFLNYIKGGLLNNLRISRFQAKARRSKEAEENSSNE